MASFTHARLAKLDAENEALQRAIVEAQTFGHLAPNAQQRYQGTMIFCHSEYGKNFIIQDNFEGLEDNPWSFNDLNDWIDTWLANHDYQCGVYKFTGYYQKFKNGNYRLVGDVKSVSLE
jgi:hypothetical protein